MSSCHHLMSSSCPCTNNIDAGLWQPNIYIDPIISGPVILDTINRNRIQCQHFLVSVKSTSVSVQISFLFIKKKLTRNNWQCTGSECEDFSLLAGLQIGYKVEIISLFTPSVLLTIHFTSQLSRVGRNSPHSILLHSA